MQKILRCQATIPPVMVEYETVDVHGNKRKGSYEKRSAKPCRQEAKWRRSIDGMFVCASCPSLLDTLREVTEQDVEAYGKV